MSFSCTPVGHGRTGFHYPVKDEATGEVVLYAQTAKQGKQVARELALYMAVGWSPVAGGMMSPLTCLVLEKKLGLVWNMVSV